MSKYQHQISNTLTIPYSDLTTILRKALRAEGVVVPDKFRVAAVTATDPHQPGATFLTGLELVWLGLVTDDESKV